jgi:hypothetical protein
MQYPLLPPEDQPPDRAAAFELPDLEKMASQRHKEISFSLQWLLDDYANVTDLTANDAENIVPDIRGFCNKTAQFKPAEPPEKSAVEMARVGTHYALHLSRLAVRGPLAWSEDGLLVDSYGKARTPSNIAWDVIGYMSERNCLSALVALMEFRIKGKMPKKGSRKG